MRNFQFARALLGLVQIAGWVSIAAGVFVFGSAFGVIDGVPMMAVGGVLAGLGFLLIALAQMSLAVIVTAENTGAMLEEMRRAAPARAAAPPSARSAVAQEVGETIKTYRGKRIVRASEGVTVGERKFRSVLDAEKFIDGSGD